MCIYIALANTTMAFITTALTRHRASTGMYSLTFCVRVMSRERHHWKPAVQAAAVMLRTLPIDGQSPASQPCPLPIYDAQFCAPPRHPPVTSEQRAQTPPSVRTVVISRDGRKLVTRVRVICCHSNATRAPIANPLNSSQLGGPGIPYHYRKLHPGPCSSVGTRPRTDRYTDACDHNTFCVVYDSRKM